MNIDHVLSVLRTVLKTAGAVLVTKGVTDESGLEAVVGGLIAGIGIAWSFWKHSKKSDL